MAKPQPKELKDIPAQLAAGLALHRAGRLVDAEWIYTQILAWDPDHFDALHLRGVLLHQRGDHAAALAHIDCALRSDAGSVVALNNRGLVLSALGRFDEALDCYDRALALRPNFPEALLNRGNALSDLKRFSQAVLNFDGAIVARPHYAEAYYNRGNALHAIDRLGEALASYDRAIALRPHYPDALCNRGITLHGLKRFDEALASHDRALALWSDYAPSHCGQGAALNALRRFDEALAAYDHAIALRSDYAEALGNRGVALNALRRFDEALASYDRALEVQPDDIEALSNRSVTLHKLRRFDEALASCDRALALRPDYAEAFSNRGNALSGLGRFEEAVASYDRAVALRPTYAEALTSRGVTLEMVKRFDESLSCYARAIDARPDFAEAHFNEGCGRLLTGDFRRGWQKYEWRWLTEQHETERRNFSEPLLTGLRDIAGKTLLLHAEQGFGDTIQFCRYVPLLVERGANVILQVQPALRGLMSTLSCATSVVAWGEAVSAFDMHCPLLSLPRAFGTELTTVPSAVPYLHAAAQETMDWGSRLGERVRPRIGLAWSGSPKHNNDHNRSMPLKSLLAALDGIDASYVSLQWELAAADAEVLAGCRDLTHFGRELRSFSDTAALISNLDLIISVDTAVAHLAGALAKPVWVLLPHSPDWRWLLDRSDSPWYPSAKLFRQDETRIWASVLDRLNAALREHLRG